MVFLCSLCCGVGCCGRVRPNDAVPKVYCAEPVAMGVAPLRAIKNSLTPLHPLATIRPYSRECGPMEVIALIVSVVSAASGSVYLIATLHRLIARQKKRGCLRWTQRSFFLGCWWDEMGLSGMKWLHMAGREYV
jgi:hypothetical protein